MEDPSTLHSTHAEGVADTKSCLDTQQPGLDVAVERTNLLVQKIQPGVHSVEKRLQIVNYVSKIVDACFSPCKVHAFQFGSVPLRTYLPDGDIDLSLVQASGPSVQQDWTDKLAKVLEREMLSKRSTHRVRDIQVIKAEVNLVKCLVDDIVVDISFQTLGGLCTVNFLEQVDREVKQDHLFKRSIILVKAWCYYESRLLGAHHGLISTYALEVLVLYIFNFYRTACTSPLKVLSQFLEVFSSFEWDNHCLTLSGPVPLNNFTTPSPAGAPPAAVPHGAKGESNSSAGMSPCMTPELLESLRSAFSQEALHVAPQNRSFQVKFLNILDPLLGSNNLGRSVSKASFVRIRKALSHGAQTLSKLLEKPPTQAVVEIDHFFRNTWTAANQHEAAEPAASQPYASPKQAQSQQVPRVQLHNRQTSAPLPGSRPGSGPHMPAGSVAALPPAFVPPLPSGPPPPPSANGLTPGPGAQQVTPGALTGPAMGVPPVFTMDLLMRLWQSQQPVNHQLWDQAYREAAAAGQHGQLGLDVQGHPGVAVLNSSPSMPTAPRAASHNTSSTLAHQRSSSLDSGQGTAAANGTMLLSMHQQQQFAGHSSAAIAAWQLQQQLQQQLLRSQPPVVGIPRNAAAGAADHTAQVSQPSPAVVGGAVGTDSADSNRSMEPGTPREEQERSDFTSLATLAAEPPLHGSTHVAVLCPAQQNASPASDDGPSNASPATGEPGSTQHSPASDTNVAMVQSAAASVKPLPAGASSGASGGSGPLLPPGASALSLQQQQHHLMQQLQQRATAMAASDTAIAVAPSVGSNWHRSTGLPPSLVHTSMNGMGTDRRSSPQERAPDRFTSQQQHPGLPALLSQHMASGGMSSSSGVGTTSTTLQQAQAVQYQQLQQQLLQQFQSQLQQGEGHTTQEGGSRGSTTARQAAELHMLLRQLPPTQQQQRAVAMMRSSSSNSLQGTSISPASSTPGSLAAAANMMGPMYLMDPRMAHAQQQFAMYSLLQQQGNAWMVPGMALQGQGPAGAPESKQDVLSGQLDELQQHLSVALTSYRDAAQGGSASAQPAAEEAARRRAPASAQQPLPGHPYTRDLRTATSHDYDRMGPPPQRHAQTGARARAPVPPYYQQEARSGFSVPSSPMSWGTPKTQYGGYERHVASFEGSSVGGQGPRGRAPPMPRNNSASQLSQFERSGYGGAPNGTAAFQQGTRNMHLPSSSDGAVPAFIGRPYAGTGFHQRHVASVPTSPRLPEPEAGVPIAQALSQPLGTHPAVQAEDVAGLLPSQPRSVSQASSVTRGTSPVPVALPGGPISVVEPGGTAVGAQQPLMPQVPTSAALTKSFLSAAAMPVVPAGVPPGVPVVSGLGVPVASAPRAMPSAASMNDIRAAAVEQPHARWQTAGRVGRNIRGTSLDSGWDGRMDHSDRRAGAGYGRTGSGSHQYHSHSAQGSAAGASRPNSRQGLMFGTGSDTGSVMGGLEGPGGGLGGVSPVVMPLELSTIQGANPSFVLADEDFPVLGGSSPGAVKEAMQAPRPSGDWGKPSKLSPSHAEKA